MKKVYDANALNYETQNSNPACFETLRKKQTDFPGINAMKIFSALVLLLVFVLNNAMGQTTYTWNATAGGDWTVSTNWTPNRTATATTDILQFNDGNTYTVTNVPTQTIRQLIVTNSSNVS